MKHKIFLVVVMMFSFGCMKLKKKGEQQKPENELVYELMSDKSGFSYEYVYSPSSKNYEVIFQVPFELKNDLYIEKSDESGQMKAELDTARGFRDFLKGDKKTIYKFYKKDHQKFDLIEEFEVLPVLDFSLTEDLNLNQKFNLNYKTKVIYFKKLEILKQAHLYLEDFSGQIIIENLETESGFIQTFPLSAKAKNNLDGRSGGTIDLKILNGDFNLSLIAVGEAGGDGSDGKPADNSMIGVLGIDGQFAKFNLTRTENCLNKKFCISKNYYSCISKPESGKVGGKGKVGHRGFDGKDGGRSGQFIVHSYSVESRINSYALAAKKGLGGVGAVGGEGGLGGMGGDGAYEDLARQLNLDFNHAGNKERFLMFNQIEIPCEPASRGAQGAVGENGKDGMVGQEGIIQKSILFLNDVKTAFANEN